MKLKCMFDKPLLVHLVMILALLTVSFASLVADVNFSSSASALVLDARYSKVRMSNPAKIVGWGERSIVTSPGNYAANVWPEAYQPEAVIGQGGQPGVTAQAYTHLVDANSNAILTLHYTGRGSADGMSRADSNALLYLHNVDSQILTMLAQGCSVAVVSVATSNAINLLYRNLAVPSADSIDGTQFAKYCTNHYVFHDNVTPWVARGWVRFNNGFTVMPQAMVLMDTLTTVSGGMDLRDTGMLILNNDLYLAHNVTLTNGGNIKGRSSSSGHVNTVFMGGDLTLAADSYARILHITGDWSNNVHSGDLIIDGCGHTLNIGNRAQIFVDQNVTLTLRNMTIKTGSKSLNNPAIQLASFGSKLALDNVMVDLGADFNFKQGQLFIHNEVAVTGTSAFVYQSPTPSYITSGAIWSFEQGTTFSVAPATFTDCPFTVNNTYINNNFIVLADATAALSLNGCSLQTTYTGLRLTKGMVLFDNKIAVNTMAGVDLDSTNPLAEIGTIGLPGASAPESVAWSPDGRYLALTCQGTNTMHIYRFDGSSGFVEIGTGLSAFANPISVSWSPDSRYLAVACNYFNVLRVYSFDGLSVPVEIGSGAVAANDPTSVAWSPDGRYLAVACGPSDSLRVYRFDGSSVPVEIGTEAPASSYPNSVAWSPDGRYLAVTCYYSEVLRVYKFDGSSMPLEIGTGAYTGIFSYPTSVAWSPDGRYLVVGCDGDSRLHTYKFDGSSVPVEVGTGVAADYGSWSVVWSRDGRYLAVACYYTDTLRVYGCNNVYSGQPAQGFTNGLLFGDSAKGAAYDANVQVLGGATVSIKGAVYDDAAV